MLKVLIYGVSLTGDKSATGISMENMFLGMPEVEFMQYCHDTKEEDHAILFNTIFLDKKCWFFDYTIRKLFVKKHSDSTPPDSDSKYKEKRFRLNHIIKGILGYMPFNKRKIDLAAIKKMEPEIIYTMAGTEQIMRTVLYLSCRLHIPIVFHCMDDWRKTIYADDGIYRIFYRHLNHLVKLINNRSVMNIGICEKMAEQYQHEYLKPYSFAGNCISDSIFDEYSPNENGMLTIIYAGGLHLNRWASLIRAADAVEKANHNGLKITLEIYVSQSDFEIYHNRFYYHHTIFTTYVSPEKQKGNLHRADLLLHAESFDKFDIKYTQLSFSTKLAEYMAAGRAILGFGDKHLASIDYISANKCGWTAETDEELFDVLNEAVKVPELRKQYAVNALTIAQKIHTKEKVQQRIYSVFKYTAENWKDE